MALIALALLSVIVLWLVGRTRWGSRIVERLVLPMPLIGRVLKWNLLARWCDGLLLGLQAGLDLPAALEIASGAVDSSRLRADSNQMIQRIQSGQAMDSEARYRFLPAIVATSLQLGSEKNDLPETVATLAKMYQEQAEARLNVLPAALGPLLLLMITGCVGLAVVAALLPLVRMLNSFMPAP
jgi:type II secretory pathway component PulF